MLRLNRNNIYYVAVGVLIAVFYMKFGKVLADKLIKSHIQPKLYQTSYSPKKAHPIDIRDFDIFVASSLDRVFQDGKTLRKPDFTESAFLSLAGNEYESFQIIIRAHKQPLASVKLEISNFVNAEKRVKLDSRYLTWRIVGYVKTKKPSYTVQFVGLWPDPLLLDQKVEVQPNSFQPFWVTVYIPPQAPNGIYKGTIKVTCEDAVLQEIPLSIKVYGFTLPVESHLKTAFDLSPAMIEARHPREENEKNPDDWLSVDRLVELYIIDMLKHRINPILDINPLSEADLAKVDKYRLYGLNNFSLGNKGGKFENNWPANNEEELEKLLWDYRGYAEALKFNKMLGFHYIYVWNEGEIGNPLVQKVTSMLHRAHPELKNMVCYNGIWDPSKDPGWGNDINIWCFQIDSFDLARIEELEKLKKELWVYVSEAGDSGSPNLVIDRDSLEYRILPWLCWKYNFKGLFYWNVNYWPYFDPYKNAMNTKTEQNGNGLLFYPGAGGPVDSLRLEILRDGMEDYEYLYLLEEKIKELENKNLTVPNQELIGRAKTLLKIDKSIAESVFSFSKDPQALIGRREEIAETIETLERQ